MQETLIQKEEINNDPKSIVEKFEKASVTRHDTQQHSTAEVAADTGLCKTATDGDVDSSVTSNEAEQAMMGEDHSQEVNKNNTIKEKDKENDEKQLPKEVEDGNADNHVDAKPVGEDSFLTSKEAEQTMIGEEKSEEVNNSSIKKDKDKINDKKRLKGEEKESADSLDVDDATGEIDTKISSISKTDQVEDRDLEETKYSNRKSDERDAKAASEETSSEKDNNGTSAVGTKDKLSAAEALTEKEKSSVDKKNGKSSTSAPASSAVEATLTPPVMRGTLSLDLDGQRHLIRGMWNYENSEALPPQRFELVRTLGPDEDKNKLPVDGVFNGSFSLAYLHTTSKGKQKERSKVVQETGVKIKFTPIPGKEGEYKVEGKGTNQFGVFHIYGKAEPSAIPDDPAMNIEFRKKYEPAPVVISETPAEPVSLSNKQVKVGKKNNSSAAVRSDVPPSGVIAGSDQDDNPGTLPEPTKSFPSGVVALRGHLFKHESTENGVAEVVHRIQGMWAAGLDLILADPQNVRGFCNRFEYEHKSSVPSQQFPVSGRYSGWFELTNDDDIAGPRQKIFDKDVTMRFKLNNAGYHNIEGKGNNVFGKFTITGTLTLDNVITIFRVFLPRKIKTKTPSDQTIVNLPTATKSDPARRPSVGPGEECKLKLEDVVISSMHINSKSENLKEPYEPIGPPATGTYSAVSQGVLRLNDDGSHSCQGKWAVTREHLNNALTSNFNFRLEPHHAQEAMETMNNLSNGDQRQFPLDSAMYKGSFQMKKQGAGSRYQTIVDQQVVMKFAKNTQGSFNVYGTGVNAIGEFNLLGTLIMSGKSGGQVELYRFYKPEKLAALPGEDVSSLDAGDNFKVDVSSTTAPAFIGYSAGAAEKIPLVRRESSRMSKLPSRLEEDDPSAQLSRIMEKCSLVMKFMREKDVELGAFFSEPVDAVALGIPTYHQVIKEPMDLRTIQLRLDANDIQSPEEFIRLVRLVFENAMTFNIDPAHSVHQAARSLLVKFNEKIRDVERLVQSIRRSHGLDEEGKMKKIKNKDEKKRKRQAEEPKSLKRQRLDEVQAMASANASAFAAIVESAPSTNTASVTRAEFNLLLSLLRQLQGQIVQTYTALADLSPGDVTEVGNNALVGSHTATQSAQRSGSVSAAKKDSSAGASAPAPEKKQVKRKSEVIKQAEPIISEDDASPLSHEEQTWLTETISELPQEHLGGVIQIIREAAPVAADEEEIDIEIDQLDHKTQRKLMKHVLKFVKKSKPKPPKKKAKVQQQQAQQQQKKPSEKSPPSKKSKTGSKSKPVTATDSFISFGGKPGSDSSESSSSDDEDDKTVTDDKDVSSEFKLSSGFGDLHNDDDDDIGSDGIAGNWNLPIPATLSNKKDDEGLEWAAAAREQAAAAKAKDADRKAREEKKKKEAEEANKKALAEAAKRKEELLAKQAEEKEKEASLLEQQEREEKKKREAAREKARAEAQSVEQTVDLGDAQRELMKQFDQSFLDSESMGGASPSSDFGF